MSKVATISSLNRVAARSEAEFIEVVQGLLQDDDLARLAEFFDKMNIPRSTGGEGLTEPLPPLTCTPDQVGDFQAEDAVSKGIQRFLERHQRKLKWHAKHPSLEGTQNVLLLMRAIMIGTDFRLQRLRFLLKSKSELTAAEWAIARTMMNSSFLTLRDCLGLMSVNWIEAVLSTLPLDELNEVVGSFYQLVDQHIRLLSGHRDAIEERRMELTVLPEGYPPVKPPNYFGGDLLGRGPWKQYWVRVENHAHLFREALG